MRHYINDLISIIDKNIINNNKSFIRVDHFNHPQIYLEICLYFKKVTSQRNENIITLLSKEKFDIFQNSGLNLDILSELTKGGFISNDDSFTKWRNEFAEDDKTIILMGTENVQDKGGIADFYSVTPLTIQENIGKKYHKWFLEYLDQMESSSEILIIDNFFSNIFQFVPVDLFKVSQIADDVYNEEIIGATEIVNFIGNTLWDYFKIPNIKEISLADIAKLRTSKKINTFEKAINFINRKDYKDSLSKAKYLKLESKLQLFEEKNPEEMLRYNDEINKYFKSYDGFKRDILNFIKGIDLEGNRERLSKLDFNIINNILDIKLPTSKKETSRVIDLYGFPLRVYSKMIIDFVRNYKNSADITDIVDRKIVVQVKEILLTDISEPDGKYNMWKSLSMSLCGVVDYINEEISDCIQISYVEGIDPFFLESFSDEKVKHTSAVEKLSKIHFKVSIEGGLTKEYRWIFSPHDYWIQSFSYLNNYRESYQENEDILPIFYTKGLGNLLSSTDREAFSYQLKNYEINYINVMKSIDPSLHTSILSTRLYQLVEPFRSFVNNICDEGFYNVINNTKNDSTVKFIYKYIEVIDYLKEKYSDLTSLEKEHLNLVANLFYIVSSKDVATKQLKLDGAIIPPYHPAMLEKILEQQSFQRKGYGEIIRSLVLNENSKQTDDDNKMERIDRQSTIISAVDTILSENSFSRIPSQVLGYYALHGEENNDVIIDSSVMIDTDIIFDENFNSKELMINTSKSQLIMNHIQQYVMTFPANADSLNLCFVNFEQLQPIIAGLHKFIEQYKELPHGINIKLHILSPSLNYKGRNYIHLWLDNFFSEEDKVQIETYYNTFDYNAVEIDKFKKMDSKYDVVFIESVLETTGIEYEQTGEKTINPSDTRFPMVFHPMPAPKKDKSRNISISQKQFQASFSHSQLLFWIERPYSEKEIYRVEKELVLRAESKDLLKYFHKNAHWVVTIDTGLDKSIFEKENIISFSTGEGTFGELNVAISSSKEMKNDISIRLKSRLQALFNSWDKEVCSKAANHCIEKSSRLDGIKVLKALNPHNYEIHSFLSSILAAETLHVEKHDEKTVLKSLISLDSYQHWFSEQYSRPDFLMLEINQDGLEAKKLTIKATLVECKMGKENEVHITKGINQLTNGIKFLTKIFNPDSLSYDRRYWYAQLYRLLAFSPNFLAESLTLRKLLNQNLLKILDGEFLIEWDTRLLTYWLDYNQEKLETKEIELEGIEISCTHKSYGQIYIQKNLLPVEEHSAIEFVNPHNAEMEVFADNEKDYEMIIQTNDISSLLNLEEDYGKEFDTSEVTLPTPLTIISGKNVSENGENNTIIDNVTNIKINPSEGTELKYTGTIEPSYVAESGLDSIRILLGEEVKTKNKYYWEYGHKELENRHILISGKSGVGKTYFMQCLLLELAKNNISSLIFDYTDGFKKSKLEPEFKEYLGEKVEQFHVQLKGFPINPFKKNMKEIDEDLFVPETNTDVAERIRSVFAAVYKGMGDQQANAIYRATMKGLEKYDSKMNLQYLKAELEMDGTGNAKTVLAKIEPLIDRNPFDMESQYNWEDHRKKEGIVFVVQLSGFVREVQLIVTEFILWDLWNFNLSHGDKSKPFPVILDEAQNLDHSEKSPSAKVLTEGRKFGWSGWYATQFMQGQMSKDEIQRLQNASQKVYFSPPESEISDVAGFLSTETHLKKEWSTKLSKIGKGQCVIAGPVLKSDGSLTRTSPVVINVSPLSERI
ncbi:DUF87 domain-containing protein [Psychrobacillus sp. PGGUH221]|uniref:ATP-binding protein n=1 Tax=Psychrobacillus sp. PGGUH221 TaxID=3020058 RepID=UPI0035C697D5